MFDNVVEFLVNQVFGSVMAAIPLPIQIVIYIALAFFGVFAGRKFILMNLVMRFFPSVFVKSMRDLGEKANQVFEAKKKNGKFKGSWKIAEEKLIEGLEAFSAEIKKP